jgi:hypothetical protein
VAGIKKEHHIVTGSVERCKMINRTPIGNENHIDINNKIALEKAME